MVQIFVNVKISFLFIACDVSCLTCTAGTYADCKVCAVGYVFSSTYCCPNASPYYLSPTQTCLI